MPFTPSHVAAILPLARAPLPAAGLAIGSMVPDLPYFVPIGIPREYTHSLIGGLTADLPMGLVAVAVWVFVLRSPLVVALWALLWARRTASVTTSYRRTGGTLRIIAWAVVLGVLAVVGGVIWIRGVIRGTMAFDRVLLYDTAVYSIAIAGAVALLFCLVWCLIPTRDQTDRSTATTLPSSSA